MAKKMKVSMASDVLVERDMFYFRNKWGEDSKWYERAGKLLRVLQDTSLEKIKHNYMMPDKFGFEVEPGKPVVWSNSRHFVESVVNSYGVARWPKQIYRDIVNYLVNENAASRNLFRTGYYEVFGATFRLLYDSLAEERRKEQEDLATKIAELDKAEQEWKTSTLTTVFSGLKSSVICDGIYALLENPGLEHDVLFEFFEPNDVASLKKTAMSMQPSKDIDEFLENCCLKKRLLECLNSMLRPPR